MEKALGPGKIIVAAIATAVTTLAMVGTATALHVGYMDTEMTAGITDAKSDPADIARIALDGIERGESEIIADDIAPRYALGWVTALPGSNPAPPAEAPAPMGPGRLLRSRRIR